MTSQSPSGPILLTRPASQRFWSLILLLLILSVAPMEVEELAHAGYQILPFYQAIILDGMKTTDGRCFVRGMDMKLNKMCLYVVIPLKAGVKIERYEYQEKR